MVSADLLGKGKGEVNKMTYIVTAEVYKEIAITVEANSEQEAEAMVESGDYGEYSGVCRAVAYEYKEGDIKD